MAGAVRFAFSASDVARTRFALSPLWEVVASVRTYQLAGGRSAVGSVAGRRSAHRRWLEAAVPKVAAAGLDRGLLFDLVPATGYTPDFITPPPPAAGADLAAELRMVAATPVAEIHRELRAFGLRTERIEAMYADPSAGIARLVAELDAYWAAALAPCWPQVRAVLEADVFHQARRLAADGAEAVLGDLHPHVRWSAGTLTISEMACAAGLDLAGQGLVLVPSVFTRSGVTTSAGSPAAKQLFYPSRGWGSVWSAERPAVPDAVAAVLGRTRALLLAELAVPASTSDLAGRTGLSAGGVNQHLTALRDAGIVSAHRSGRSVLYMRTAVAESLLAAAVG
ncbi:ArsR/SmtB family transcription factor [Streptomyces sp. NBC_00448]|uniref:ArsR/SmtB family transcription factor n=1 Tax=Streptomyces sp. NBC_00448 TaxID=2903652 RepID=UPI002E226008